MGKVQARGFDGHVLGDHRQGHRARVLADGSAAGKSAEQGGPEGPGEARWLGVGRGEYDPVTGLYEWYEGGLPTSRESGSLSGLTWEQLLQQWPLIEADLHQVYGIDVEDGILRERPWRWFQARVLGLLSCESRLHRRFAPPPEDPKNHTPRRR